MKSVYLIFILTSSISIITLAQKTNVQNPVVVEMFTSEGCSSCPPADKVMEGLQKEYAHQNKPVYFIAFHVDYWNYLGWKDQFSSAENTKRQNGYANVFGTASIYTPQAVINGQKEMVGSKWQLLKQTIDLALEMKNTESLTLTYIYKTNQDKIILNYSYSGENDDKDICFVLLENQHTVKVLKGENRGETLNHINIVKQWKAEKLKREGSYEFILKEKILISDHKLLAFVSNSKDKKILTAAVAAK